MARDNRSPERACHSAAISETVVQFLDGSSNGIAPQNQEGWEWFISQKHPETSNQIEKYAEASWNATRFHGTPISTPGATSETSVPAESDHVSDT